MSNFVQRMQEAMRNIAASIARQARRGDMPRRVPRIGVSDLHNWTGPFNTPQAPKRIKDPESDSVGSVSGKRQGADYFNVVPYVVGKHKVYLPLIARPYVTRIYNRDYAHLLYAVCQCSVDTNGDVYPHRIRDIRVGGKPIGEMDVEYDAFIWGDANTTWADTITSDDVEATLADPFSPPTYSEASSSSRGKSVQVDLDLPEGINDGFSNGVPVESYFDVKWSVKPTGVDGWIDVPDLERQVHVEYKPGGGPTLTALNTPVYWVHSVVRIQYSEGRTSIVERLRVQDIFVDYDAGTITRRDGEDWSYAANEEWRVVYEVDPVSTYVVSALTTATQLNARLNICNTILNVINGAIAAWLAAHPGTPWPVRDVLQTVMLAEIVKIQSRLAEEAVTNPITAGYLTTLNSRLATLYTYVTNFDPVAGPPNPGDATNKVVNDIVAGTLSMLEVLLSCFHQLTWRPLMMPNDSGLPDDRRMRFLAAQYAALLKPFDDAGYTFDTPPSDFIHRFEGSSGDYEKRGLFVDAVLNSHYDVRVGLYGTGAIEFDVIWKRLRILGEDRIPTLENTMVLALRYPLDDDITESTVERMPVSCVVSACVNTWNDTFSQWDLIPTPSGESDVVVDYLSADARAPQYALQVTQPGIDDSPGTGVVTIYDMFQDPPLLIFEPTTVDYEAGTITKDGGDPWWAGVDRWKVTYYSTGAVARNPAWWFLDILLGVSNKRPVQDGWPTWGGAAFDPDKIDMPSILEWADYCDEQGWEVSFVITDSTTVLDALNLLCAAGRASLRYADGKYGVVIDKDKSDDDPAQLLTARNTRDFGVERALIEPPHALKLQFVNENESYVDDQVIVYDDGYNADGESELVSEALYGGSAQLQVSYFPIDNDPSKGVVQIYDLQTDTVFSDPVTIDYANGTIEITAGGDWPTAAWPRWQVTYWAEKTAATLYEAMTLPGIVNPEMVWRYGRHLIAAAKNRARKMTFNIDIEQLRVQRGDLCRLQHANILTGLYSGFHVTEVEEDGGGNVTGVHIDDNVWFEGGKDYALTVRYADGDIQEIDVVAGVPGTAYDELTFVANAPLSGTGLKIQAGDLCAFGERGAVTTDVIVTAIEPEDNLSARVTCIDHVPAVYDAEKGPYTIFVPTTTLPPPDDLDIPESPYIDSVISDESVMVRLQDRLVTRIAVAFRLPDRLLSDRSITGIGCQYRFTSAEAAWGKNQKAGWITLDNTPISQGVVYIPNVIDGQYYDIRIRTIGYAGLASHWTYEYSHQVVGKSTPPPDVESLHVMTGYLTWDYDNPPIDLAGFRIKSYPAQYWVEDMWDTSYEIHGGLVTERRFPIPDDLRWGERTFLIKAVDAAGNESEQAAVLYVDLGSPDADNVTLTTDYHATGFPGAITEGEVEAGTGDLVGSLYASLFWQGGDGTNFWKPPDSALFWNFDWTGIQYEFQFTVPAGATGRLVLSYTAAGLADNQRVTLYELLAEDDEFFWRPPSDGLFWGGDAGLFWVKSVMTAWREFSGVREVEPSTSYTFRLIIADPSDPFGAGSNYDSQCRITALTGVLDVPDIVESFAGLVDPGGGVRIPLTKPFNAAIHVLLSMIDNPALPTNITLNVVDKQIPPAQIGPLIMARDANNLPAPAPVTFDATVKGY